MVSLGHSLYQVWKLWDHPFFELSCGQTNKQTDGPERATHLDRVILNTACDLDSWFVLIYIHIYFLEYAANSIHV